MLAATGSILPLRGHPLRQQAVNKVKESQRLQKAGQQGPTGKPLYPELDRLLRKLEADLERSEQQINDSLDHVAPRMKRPLNWDLLKQNARNPSAVDEVRRMFEELNAARTEIESQKELLNPPDEALELIQSKPPPLSEQFDDLIRAGRFEKALKYPEFYVESFRYWLQRYQVGPMGRPADVAAMHTQYRLAIQFEKVARRVARTMEVVYEEAKSEIAAFERIWELDTGHFDEILLQRMTNNAEQKAVAEIREQLQARGITSGVEIVEPDFNPLQFASNKFPFKSLQLPLNMFLDHRYAVKEHIYNPGPWNPEEHTKTVIKAFHDPGYLMQMQDALYEATTECYLDWRPEYFAGLPEWEEEQARNAAEREARKKYYKMLSNYEVKLPGWEHLKQEPEEPLV